MLVTLRPEVGPTDGTAAPAVGQVSDCPLRCLWYFQGWPAAYCARVKVASIQDLDDPKEPIQGPIVQALPGDDLRKKGVLPETSANTPTLWLEPSLYGTTTITTPDFPYSA